MRTTFRNLADLASLPYFKIEDGRLVLADKSIGPAIDMHTHVALAYLAPNNVDYDHLAPETQHYLPACCAIDFDVYQNKNIPTPDVVALKSDLTLGSFRRGGMRATHTAANMLREMNELGIERSAVLAIDLPVISKNYAVAAALSRKNSRFVAFGSLHPYALHIDKALDEQLGLGVMGIKLHPTVQLFRPDDPRASKIYKGCSDRGLAVLIHCGPVGIAPGLGEYLTQVRWYEKPIVKHPETKFILAHAGALEFEQATELARKYPNVYLEISGQSLRGIRLMIERVDPSRILLGSDWPFYHQAIGMAKVLMLTEGNKKLRRDILYRNAVKLLNLPN